jgi:hypothetical protein
MHPALRPGGLLLVGEPYWISEPPNEAYDALQIGPDEITLLVGTYDWLAASTERRMTAALQQCAISDGEAS